MKTWTCRLGICICLVTASSASPRQDPAQVKADQTTALAARQRAEQIQDLYEQIQRIEEDRTSAEANAQQAQAAPPAYIPSKDPTVAAEQAANQAAAQARADSARSALADSAQRIRDLTNEIAFLEGNRPIGSIDPAMDLAGSDKQAGTWTLDLAKSEFVGAAPKAETERVAVVDGGLRSIDDRINSDGTRTHTEWTAKYDARSYAVKGGSNRSTISLYQTDDGSLRFLRQDNGKTTASGRIACSSDGTSRTVTTTVLNSQGKQVTMVSLWTRQ
jgi:hypothetical protein